MKLENKILNVSEIREIVNAIVDGVLAEYNGEIIFMPELIEPYKTIIFCRYFLDLETSADLDKDYLAALEVSKDIDWTLLPQYQLLEDVLAQKLAFEKEKLLRRNITVRSSLDAFIPYVETLLTTFNEKIAALDPQVLDHLLKTYGGSENITSALNNLAEENDDKSQK